MNPEQLAEGIHKGLEIWTLQNLCDTSIILGFVVLGLIIGRAYLEAFKDRLTLRIAVETWDTAIDLGADLILFGIAIAGLLTTNPDIMADIKIALPWLPLASLMMGAALILRAFYGGHVLRSRSWWLALVLVSTGCVLNWFGFTFVMEAATLEYFPVHPSVFWSTLQAMRSDMNHRLALSTFMWAGPAFAVLFGWAVLAGTRMTVRWSRKSGHSAVQNGQGTSGN